MSAGAPILVDDLRKIVQGFSKEYSSKYSIVYNELLFKKSMRELENTFISIEKDSSDRFKIEYQNPSVQDFLVFYFREYSEYITDILKTANNFNQLFGVFSFKEDYDFATTNRILLSKEQREIVIDRIYNDFDYLNSTVLRKYSSSFAKEHFSDFIKLNEILNYFDIEDYPNLQELILKRFKEIMFDGKNQLDDDEMSSYINIVEYFADEFKGDIRKMLNKVADGIIDLETFEEFERFESIYGDDYMDIITNDEIHQRRIRTLMTIQIEHEEDYLEDLLDEYVERAKKYKIDYSEIKESIEEKIANKEIDEDSGFDWEAHKQKRKAEKEKEDDSIKNIFDSFKAIEKNGG